MVKRAKFTTPKLWVRRNRRLCRRNSVDDSLGGCQNISNDSWRGPQSSILDLPEECLVIVFKSLTFYEIANVARVCKRFYHVCWNSTLWSCIDLSFQDFCSFYRASLTDTADSYSWTEVITNAKRRTLLASFLSARKAALTEIYAHGDFNIFREEDVFICLLNNCNVKNLKKISLRLPYCWRYTTTNVRALQRFLRCLVERCWNVLKFLRCYVDVSHTTAKLLGSLHSLEHLNLHFHLQDVLQPDAMDAILSSLPNLKYLKITIRQYISDEYFPGYKLKSDSLEILDFGHTKEFLIKQLILPKLHTIDAKCLHNYHQMQRALCLFDLVERGCPRIQTLNGFTSSVPGLSNFHLSEIQKKKLYFCICPLHAPWTIIFGV